MRLSAVALIVAGGVVLGSNADGPVQAGGPRQASSQADAASPSDHQDALRSTASPATISAGRLRSSRSMRSTSRVQPTGRMSGKR
jgi:hypothetical protein